jgi:glycosyltransferase involved in cell wall biosynthesis
MFSIVIPLYNKRAYVSKTLSSVLAQSYRKFEVIVVDDGSTDGSRELVSEFDDPRVSLLAISRSGVSTARNTGIDAAKFSWIAFLDADDWWAPDFLESMRECINQFPDQLVFASGRSRVFRCIEERYNNEFLPSEGQTAPVDYIEVISKYLPLVNSSNCVIGKQLICSRGSFRPGQRMHEDHDLWLRLCWDNPVIFCNRNLSFHRKQIENSGSKQLYNSQDLLIYLNTLAEIRHLLSGTRHQHFQRYLNPFVLVTFFKNYGSYTKYERKMVYETSSKIVTNQYLWFLKFLHFFPYRNAYDILRLFRRR